MKKFKLIILFGSQVTGRANHNSDYDLAVLGAKPLTMRDVGEVIDWGAKKLKALDDKIDVVDLLTASPLLKHQVAKHGKLLLGTEDEFLSFQIAAWKEYVDTARLRRWREKVLEKAFLK